MTRLRSIFGPRWRLRPGSAVPAYAQIEDQLAARIESGELRVCERLPPERDLAGGLGVSRVTVRETPAPDAIAPALRIEEGAPVYRIQRLRFGAGVPMALEDSWLPAAPFPGLLDLGLTRSLYGLMRDLYELEPVRAVERLEPVLARAHEAAALEVSEGSPLMLVERTAWAADGTAVEFAHDRHRGDRARFTIEIAS